MGGCCCCDVDTETTALVQGAGPGQFSTTVADHPKWDAELIAELGRDSRAVSRDFPRLKITIVVDNKVEYVPVELPPTNVSGRSAECREIVLRLAKLFGEHAEYHDRIDRAWQVAAKSNPNDITLSVWDACVGSGIVSAGGKAQSRTFAALQCFAQGVPFSASARMQYLLSFPWVPHIQDVWWSTIVSYDSRFSEHVTITHEYDVKNYVDRGSAKHTPEFQVRWRVSILLSTATATVLACNLEATDAWITAAPNCPSSAFLRRHNAFVARMRDVFSLGVTTVDELPGSIAGKQGHRGHRAEASRVSKK